VQHRDEPDPPPSSSPVGYRLSRAGKRPISAGFCFARGSEAGVRDDEKLGAAGPAALRICRAPRWDEQGRSYPGRGTFCRQAHPGPPPPPIHTHTQQLPCFQLTTRSFLQESTSRTDPPPIPSPPLPGFTHDSFAAAWVLLHPWDGVTFNSGCLKLCGTVLSGA